MNFFFQKPCVYEIMWKNIVQPGRPQMTTRHMSFSCCITNATNTHSEYITLIDFPLQQWLYEHTTLLLCTYIACVITINLTMPYKLYRSVVYCKGWAWKVTVNNELDKYGKKGLWIPFKKLSNHIPARSEENHENI